jgi:prepilin-type N-terminal cleavage/methylation domain-containing protein
MISCSLNRRGFTLIEMILYVALFSVFFAGIFSVFQQASDAFTKNRLSREVQENVMSAMEYVQDELRKGADPALFETYTQSVVVGGQNVTITKLRTTAGPYDLTSDHVTITAFSVSPQVQITAESVNPGDDPFYDVSFSLTRTVQARPEL